ncbi:MAG: ExbD/TolR family protein [Phycisphaeraceae bacterium]
MGFASESRERVRPVLPLAGMVDILFLLLIFFMSTYSMREQELSVDVGLPASESAEAGSNQALKVVITYDAENRVFLGERLLPLDQLETELAKLAAISTDQPVILRGDKEASVGLQSRIMDAAYAVGLEDIRLSRVGKE